MQRIVAIVILLSLLMACSDSRDSISVRNSSAPPAQPSGQVSGMPAESNATFVVELNPKSADKHDTLYVTAHGFALSAARIEWLVNGRPVMSPSVVNVFPLGNAKSGDSIQLKVVHENRELFSNTVVVQNSPPKITSVSLFPEVTDSEGLLKAEVAASDPDGDPVTILYEWKKNDVPAGNESRIASAVKRGDNVEIKIVPFDAKKYGNPLVLHRRIQNMPPSIKDNLEHTFDGATYHYQVLAQDPDSDPLVFELRNAPAGMMLERNTGFITWKVPAGFKGKVNFRVVVTDGNGGEVVKDFIFKITDLVQ